jgi:hypothetical protein
MTPKEIAQEYKASLEALTIVKESRNIYLLKFKLAQEGHDFSYLMNELNNGIKRGVYSSNEVNESLKQNKDIWCMCALDMVKNGDPYKNWKDLLNKGIETALFSKEEKSEAISNGIQIQYKKIMEEARKNPKPKESNIIAWLPRECL